MTEIELKSFYERRKESYSTKLASTNKKIARISNLRLAAAIAFFLLGYLSLKTHDVFYTLPIVVAIFVALVRQHGRLFKEKTRLENLVDIQKLELHSLEGDYSHNSSGSEFVNVHHPYTHDLDIFGEGSIFQYINRANTRDGKKLLAGRLAGKGKSIDEIRQWREAISEVTVKVDFRQEVQALSMQVNEQSNDKSELERWLAEPSFIYGKGIYKFVLNVFPPVTILLVVTAFLVEGISAFAIFAAALQWIFLGFHLKRINQFHQYISRKKTSLEKYAGILQHIRQEEHRSSLMRSIGARAGKGDEKVKGLASLVGAFDARLNSMTNLFVNSLLLYDLQCVYRLEKWKDENASELMGWLDAINESEALCSFGTFAFNHPSFAVAEVTDEQQLVAVGLGHPLLPVGERVSNDVTLGTEHSVMIITGANMAGKSTFLRSLGVNVVLALAGAPVCAHKFSCPFIEVRSGMRTADSLKENQSYFYAELDRLKSIMDELRAGKQLLILLDEILKGTNSTDKQAGSFALVKQLINHSCLVVIATHDLALGDLERTYPRNVANYSFEPHIEHDQLFFDYKLRRGIAEKMNATFLMRKMGIIGGSDEGRVTNEASPFGK